MAAIDSRIPANVTIVYRGSGGDLATDVLAVLDETEMRRFLERLGTDQRVRDYAPQLTHAVVCLDNFDRSGEEPGRDERFIGWFSSVGEARRVAQLLNESCTDHSPYYHKVVERGYQLREFKP